MSQPDSAPTWLAWVVPVGTLIGALWAFLRRFFAMATKAELIKAVEKSDAKIEERHQQNQQDNADLKATVRTMELTLARIEERIESLGRYPNLLGKR